MTKSISLTKKTIGSGSLLLIGVLFGLSGVMAKYLSEWLTAYQVVEYRFAIALIGLLLILLVFRPKISFRGISKKVLVLYAITFPISVILFTLSIFNGSVALAVFSFYTATLVSSFVIGRLFFKEKIHAYKQLSLLAILVGVVAFTDPLYNLSLNLGLVFGLLSGVVQGIASSFQKVLSNHANKTSLLVIQCLAGVALAMVATLSVQEPLFVNLGVIQWIIVAAFGLAMLAITYLFLVGFKYTNLNTGSILVSSELFFGPFFALLLLSEQLSIGMVVGGAFVALATVLSVLSAPRRSRVK